MYNFNRKIHYIFIFIITSLVIGLSPFNFLNLNAQTISTNPDQEVDADSWPNYAKNPQRTAFSPKRITPPLEIKWEWNQGKLKWGYSNDTVLLASEGMIIGRSVGDYTMLYVLNGFNGSFIRNIKLEGLGWYSIYKNILIAKRCCGTMLSHGVVNVDLYGGGSYCINVSGAMLMLAEPLIYNGIFYYTGAVSCVQAIDDAWMTANKLSLCEGIWTYATIDSGPLWSLLYTPNLKAEHLSMVDQVFYIMNYTPNILWAKDANTGKDLWSYPNAAASPSGEPGAVYFYDKSSKQAIKANSKTGQIIWKTPVELVVNNPPAISEELVIFAGTNNKIVAFDKKTGELKWSYLLPSGFQYNSYQHAPLAIAKDILYFSGGTKIDRTNKITDYKLYALDITTGNLLWSKPGIFSSPIIANNMLYTVYEDISTGDFYVQAYTGQEPTPRINQNQAVLNIEGGKPLTLDASASFAASGKTIEKYSWDLGDGNIQEGKVISHSYLEPLSLKEHQVTLTVTDNKGITANKTIKVEVTPIDNSFHLEKSSGVFNSKLIKTNQNDLVIVYDKGGNIYYKTSKDKGTTWSPAQLVVSKGKYNQRFSDAYIDQSNNTLYIISVSRSQTYGSKAGYYLHRLNYNNLDSTWTFLDSKEIASAENSWEEWDTDKSIYRKGHIFKDEKNLFWFIYSKGYYDYEFGINYRFSNDQGKTWSTEKALTSIGYYPEPKHFEADLWNGQPIVFFYNFGQEGLADSKDFRYQTYYWNGEYFMNFSPPKAMSHYLGSNDYNASFLVEPYSQSLHMAYKIAGGIEHQSKDNSTNNNWQRSTREVTPTHQTVPDDQYIFLVSDGFNPYLLYGEWVRRSGEGFHYNIALKKYIPNYGWSKETIYISPDAKVNMKIVSLKDISDLDYLPVVWQEKQGANYILKFKAFPLEELKKPRLVSQQSVSRENNILTYTITYQNLGKETAKNTIIKSPIPQGTTYQTSSKGGVYNDSLKTISWNLGEITSNQSGVLSFQVIINPSPPSQIAGYSEITYQDQEGQFYGPTKTNYVFTVTDTTPPVISNVRVTENTINHSKGEIVIKIEWQTNELSITKLEWGKDENYGYSRTDTTFRTFHLLRWDYWLWRLQPDTTYHYRVIAKDTYGNESISEDMTFTTLKNQPPVAVLEIGGSPSTWWTLISPLPLYYANERIYFSPAKSYDSDDPKKGCAYIEKVCFDFGDGSPAECVEGGLRCLARTHTYIQKGTYTITLTVKDYFGFSGTETKTIKTIFRPAPPSNFTASLIGNNQVSFSWNPSTSTDIVGYDIYQGLAYYYDWYKKYYCTLSFPTKINSQLITENKYSYNESKDGNYCYAVVAINEDKGESLRTAATNVITISPVSITDTSPPTITLTSPSSGLTVSGTVIIKADASDNVAVAGVQFKVDGTTNIGSEDIVSPYEISWDTTKIPNGTHVLTATVRDTSNNTATTSISVIVKNVLLPDTTPPSTPTNLQAAVVSSSRINLSWSASTDNVGVAGYKIYRDGGVTPIATVTTTSYSDIGLTASTTYTYQVSAYDTVNNESSRSLSVSATTQSLPLCGDGICAASETCTSCPADCGQCPLGQIITWTGKAGDNKWSNPLNWSENILPGPNDEVVFKSGGNITWDTSVSPQIKSLSLTLNDYSNLTISGTGTINNDLKLLTPYGSINGGTLNVSGNVTVGSNFSGGTTKLILNGSLNQTLSSTGGSLPNVEINKPSGLLFLSGNVYVAGNWTYSKGQLGPEGTLVFTGGSKTFTPGSAIYPNITLKLNGWSNLTVSGTGTISKNLNLLTEYGSILGGTLNVGGNVTVGGTFSGGTTKLILNGSLNQTLSSTGGSLPNVEINKPSGLLFLSGNVYVAGNWTHLQGQLAPEGTLIFTGSSTTFSPGTASYYNVTVNKGDWNSLTISGTGNITNNLNLLTRYSSISGGILNVKGNVTVGSNFSGGTTKLILNGSLNQTLSSTGGSLPNVEINKPSGLLFLSGNVYVAGNWTHLQGQLAPEGTLIFTGSSTTFSPGTASYYNVTVNKGDWNSLTISGTGNITNNLNLLTRYGSIKGGTLNVKGNVEVGTNFDLKNSTTVINKITGGVSWTRNILDVLDLMANILNTLNKLIREMK